MQELIRLIYVSQQTIRLSDSQFLALFDKSQARNASLGISGMLVRSKTRYFQILEGENCTVESLYESIKNDKRHNNLTLLTRQSITSRHFDSWQRQSSLANIPQNTLLSILTEMTGLTEFLETDELFRR